MGRTQAERGRNWLGRCSRVRTPGITRVLITRCLANNDSLDFASTLPGEQRSGFSELARKRALASVGSELLKFQR